MTFATRNAFFAKLDRFCNGFVHAFSYESTLPGMLISLSVLHVSELQESYSQDVYKHNAFHMILVAFSHKRLHNE